MGSENAPPDFTLHFSVAVLNRVHNKILHFIGLRDTRRRSCTAGATSSALRITTRPLALTFSGNLRKRAPKSAFRVHVRVASKNLLNLGAVLLRVETREFLRKRTEGALVGELGPGGLGRDRPCLFPRRSAGVFSNRSHVYHLSASVAAVLVSENIAVILSLPVLTIFRSKPNLALGASQEHRVFLGLRTSSPFFRSLVARLFDFAAGLLNALFRSRPASLFLRIRLGLRRWRDVAGQITDVDFEFVSQDTFSTSPVLYASSVPGEFVVTDPCASEVASHPW